MGKRKLAVDNQPKITQAFKKKAVTGENGQI